MVLPILGDLFSIGETTENDSYGYTAQGLHDLDGDGRDDFIVATWRGNTDSDDNPSDQWEESNVSNAECNEGLLFFTQRGIF